MQKHSIGKRFFFKILTSVITLFANLLALTIVPKSLGPFAYGQFGFLRSHFANVINFFNTGSSQAFFNYNSKNDTSYASILLYSVFVGLISSVVLVASWLVIRLKVGHYIWPEVESKHIIWGAALGLATWLFTIVTGFGDSKGHTVQVEVLKQASKIVGIAVLFVLYFLKLITLTSYFLYSILFLLLPVLLSSVYYHKFKLAGDERSIRTDELKCLAKYYYSFCSPLFLYSIFSLIYDIFDRWFLQITAGSVEQGYYSIAFNYASLCMMIIMAMNPIFMREFSKAHGEKKFDELQLLFSKYLRLIYFLVAVLAVFFAFHSNEVLRLFAGQEYQAASWAFFLMAFYPLNAVYGQLNASVYFSTERTQTYRNVLLCIMFIGAPLSYFLMARRDFMVPGFELGAMGLSVKKLSTQFIAVNALAYFNCRYLKMKFRRFLIHQMFLVAVLFLALWLIKGGTILSDISAGQLDLIRMLVTGFIYSILVVAIIYCMPSVAGLERSEVTKLKNKLFSFARKK